VDVAVAGGSHSALQPGGIREIRREIEGEACHHPLKKLQTETAFCLDKQFYLMQRVETMKIKKNRD